MKTIREAAGHPLEWTQRSVFRREFELRAGDDIVAILRWEKTFGSLARAETAEGIWTFKRSGFLRPKVTVREAGTESDIAVFKPNWIGEGTLQFTDAGRYTWAKCSFWGDQWAFADDMGNPMVYFKPKISLLAKKVEVNIQPEALSAPDLPLLALLGWYLLVLLSEEEQDAAAAAASIV